MAKFELSVDIKRPVEDVFDYVTNPSSVPEWSSIYFDTKLDGLGPLAVGSRITSASRFLGRRIDMTSEVTEYELNRRFSARSISDRVKGCAEYRFEPTGQGTRVHLKMEGEAPGVFKVADSVLSGLMKRRYETDLGTLKVLLEAHVLAPPIDGDGNG